MRKPKKENRLRSLKPNGWFEWQKYDNYYTVTFVSKDQVHTFKSIKKEGNKYRFAAIMRGDLGSSLYNPATGIMTGSVNGNRFRIKLRRSSYKKRR